LLLDHEPELLERLARRPRLFDELARVRLAGEGDQRSAEASVSSFRSVARLVLEEGDATS